MLKKIKIYLKIIKIIPRLECLSQKRRSKTILLISSCHEKISYDDYLKMNDTILKISLLCTTKDPDRQAKLL